MLSDEVVFELAGNYDCGTEGENQRWIFSIPYQILTFAESISEATMKKYHEETNQLMADMTPPATTRDRWMFHQGALAYKDAKPFDFHAAFNGDSEALENCSKHLTLEEVEVIDSGMCGSREFADIFANRVIDAYLSKQKVK